MSDLSKTKLEQAATWKVRLTEARQTHQEAFEAWCALDPENVDAWARVNNEWDLIGEFAASPEFLHMRHKALQDAKIVRKTHSRANFLRRVMLAAVSTAATLSLGLFLFYYLSDYYHTGIGERHTFVLDDGSRISMDSKSRLKVHMSESVREIFLQEGQVRFLVAKDVQRPFIVKAGGNKIVATGTDFNVDLVKDSTKVTLIEGGVEVLLDEPAVKPGEPATKQIHLKPGQQIVAGGVSDLEVKKVDPINVVAWEKGQTVVENELLSDVVAKMNRYSRTHIVVSHSVENFRISGVFSTNDIMNFIEAVTFYLPVSAKRISQTEIQLVASGTYKDT